MGLYDEQYERHGCPATPIPTLASNEANTMNNFVLAKEIKG